MENNIQEQYCSFEVSKLLKEKGLLPYKPMGYTTTYYHPTTQSIIHHGLHGRNDINTLIYRVPHSIAIRWLWINFGIWIGVSFDAWASELFYWQITRKNDRELHVEDDIDYASAEESIEVALLYTLQNLI